LADGLGPMSYLIGKLDAKGGRSAVERVHTVCRCGKRYRLVHGTNQEGIAILLGLGGSPPSGMRSRSCRAGGVGRAGSLAHHDIIVTDKRAALRSRVGRHF
jgi:hypothetical protein